MNLNVEVYENNMSSRRFFSLLAGLPYESSWAIWYRDKTNREFVTPFINVN